MEKNTTIKNNDSNFATSDLGLASAMVSLKQRLIKIEKQNPNKSKFIFKSSDKLEIIITKYWAGNLKIDARTLLDNQKMLKTRIYANQ